MPLPPKVTEEREAFVKKVVEDIRAGKDETIDELCRVLQKLMK